VFAPKAEHAALDMHHPVIVVKGGEGNRLNQLEAFKPGGTYRAGLGLPGPAIIGLPKCLSRFFKRSRAALSLEKQGVAEPEEDNTDKYKKENLQHGNRYYHNSGLPRSINKK
jgi:hypothetical protein